jgi:hypothetical protein
LTPSTPRGVVHPRGNTVKIFGREPTVVLQTVSAVLAVVVAFGFASLTAEQATLITAFLTALIGVVNAVLVRPVAPPAFIAFISSGAALLAGYGLEFSQEQVGSVTVAVLATLTLLARGQVTPVTDPRPAEQVVG